MDPEANSMEQWRILENGDPADMDRAETLALAYSEWRRNGGFPAITDPPFPYDWHRAGMRAHAPRAIIADLCDMLLNDGIDIEQDRCDPEALRNTARQLSDLADLMDEVR